MLGLFFFQVKKKKKEKPSCPCTFRGLEGLPATAFLVTRALGGFTNGHARDCHLVEMIEIKTILF